MYMENEKGKYLFFKELNSISQKDLNSLIDALVRLESKKDINENALNDELIAEHVSTVAGALSLGKSRKAKSSIASCCRGVAHTAFGFKWKYK